MLLPIDDNSLENGFCCGEYDVTVDDGPHIRLARSIVATLKENKVAKLWRFQDPTGNRMIICPGLNRKAYLKLAKQHLPESMKTAEAERKFLCTGAPIVLRSHGKVPIPSSCRNRLRIAAGQQAVIVGVGAWYEVWRQDEWSNIKEEETRAQHASGAVPVCSNSCQDCPKRNSARPRRRFQSVRE